MARPGDPIVGRHPAPLESAAQKTILDLATLLHRWQSYHTYDSRKSEGGFPDLVLVRDRVLFAELKREGKEPRADQVEWLNVLARAGAEAYLWTLDDLEEISRILGPRWDFTPYGLIGRGVVRHWEPGSQWIAGHGRRDDARA